MNFDSLGSRLRTARKALPRKQDEMAAICGVSREMWGKYERGVAIPGGEVLAKVAATGVDVLYILTGTHSAMQAQDALSDVRTATAAAVELGGTAHQQAQTQEAVFNQLRVPAPTPLTPRERALLDNYKHSDEAGKKIIEGTASLAAQPKAARSGK